MNPNDEDSLTTQRENEQFGLAYNRYRAKKELKRLMNIRDEQIYDERNETYLGE